MKPTRLLNLILSTILMLVFTGISHADDRLDEARKKFSIGGEPNFKAGFALCVAVDTAEAAEVILDVMNQTGPGPRLPWSHYRDIVWDGLIQFQDPYARGRVELELKKNKGSAWVREWCALALGVYGDPDFAGALIKASKDKDPYVRAAAVESLGLLRLPAGGESMEKVLKALGKAVKNKEPIGRANAHIAALRLAPTAYLPTYRAAFFGKAADKDGGVRCALLRALPKVEGLDSDVVEQASTDLMGDTDWRVRMQAVHNLGVTKTKTAVGTLILIADDGRPTVRLKAIAALQTMTGRGERSAKAFALWWKSNREKFSFPEGKAKRDVAGEGESVAVYNGMRVTSDNVAFLIDKSIAMGEWLDSEAMTKADFAQQQLEEVLKQLPEGTHFNVYTYGMEVETFSKKKQAVLGKKSVKKALAFVADKKSRGPKDIWQVLELVVSNPNIDTIYLLSSGEPDQGKYVHPNRVNLHLASINRFQNVTVNTIVYSSNEWHRTQLEEIAKTTGGEFKAYE